jgi:hypothetical protein
MDNCLEILDAKIIHCNLILGNYDPVKVVLFSVGSTWVFCKLAHAYSECEEGILVATKKKIFKIVRKLPWVEREIQKELGKSMASLKKDNSEQVL